MKRKYRKNKFKKFILTMIILLIIIVNLSMVIYAATTDKTTITCSDENMYTALKDALSSYIGVGDANKTDLTIKIPTDDISKITQINLDNKKITNITGIEKLTSLTNVSIAKNNITNISPLSSLNNLTTLNLNENSALGSNISSVLSSKTKITTLKISNTGISDISFLSKLPVLKTLEAANNSISNVSSLEGISTLNYLDVSGNSSLRSIKSFLNMKTLKSLNISNTGITTLETDSEREIGIYNLRNLTELRVSGLSVSLDPIVKSYYVEQHHLDEYGNWIGQDVAYLLNLKILDIGYVNRNDDIYIPSFYNLASLENIEELYIQGNNLTSVDYIYMMQNLKKVNLEENKIENIDGFYNEEERYNDNGNPYIHRTVTNATSIDLRDNEIDDISIFTKLSTSSITYLNLSGNHIYNTDPIESIGGTVKLQDQVINMPIYKKTAKTDQYIFLLQIMQRAKDTRSKLYSSSAQYEPEGCTLNTDSNYQAVELYNVIIPNSKTKNDNVNVTLNGGIADGTVINFIITDERYDAIDSLIFNDENLNRAIYNSLRESENIEYLVSGKSILNINHNVIEEIERLDLANGGIKDLSGLENFNKLRYLDISKNSGIKSIEPIQYCAELETLNASETSVGNNIAAIESLENLKILGLNSVGLTNINSINNLTKKLKDKQENEGGYGPTLTELDVSANSLKNLNGVEDIVSLKKLVAPNNQITEIPDISKLPDLETLTMYSNKITKMVKVNEEKKLRYIYLEDNKISDISELSKLTKITQLDLSRNLLDNNDLKELKSVEIGNSLKISGNNISDIASIKTSIGKVAELDISKNMIQDVSVVDSRFSNNGTLTANNQRIGVVLEQTDQDIVTIDLPQIFTAAKDSSSYFYTASNFETNHCTVSGTKVTINIRELGRNIATVKIIGGKAADTTFSVAAPIESTISYSTSEWTKEDVLATINFTNRNDVTIKNNDGNNIYTFKQNGEFTFEYVDEYGMEGTTIAKVEWIDKEAPEVTGVENGKTYSESVTPTIKDNHELQSVILKKDGSNVEGYTSGSEITEKGEYILTAKDSVGNETTITFTITDEIPDPAPDPDPDPEQESLTSEVYLINHEDKIIKNIEPETSINTFKDNIDCTSEYELKGKDENNLSEDSNIGTGCKIVTNLGTYTLVVKGDLNGNAKLDLNDLAQAQKINLDLLEDEKLKVLAADLNQNGKIDLNDLAKLQKMFLGM